MDLKPRGDAHIAACALHLLLAQHPELVDFPARWEITEDATIRPKLDVDHPDAERFAELLAKALELPLEVAEYASRNDSVRRRSLRCEGRWGGAEWYSVQYLAVPVGTLRAVAS